MLYNSTTHIVLQALLHTHMMLASHQVPALRATCAMLAAPSLQPALLAWFRSHWLAAGAARGSTVHLNSSTLGAGLRDNGGVDVSIVEEASTSRSAAVAQVAAPGMSLATPVADKGCGVPGASGPDSAWDTSLHLETHSTATLAHPVAVVLGEIWHQLLDLCCGLTHEPGWWQFLVREAARQLEVASSSLSAAADKSTESADAGAEPLSLDLAFWLEWVAGLGKAGANDNSAPSTAQPQRQLDTSHHPQHSQHLESVEVSGAQELHPHHKGVVLGEAQTMVQAALSAIRTGQEDLGAGSMDLQHVVHELMQAVRSGEVMAEALQHCKESHCGLLQARAAVNSCLVALNT